MDLCADGDSETAASCECAAVHRVALQEISNALLNAVVCATVLSVACRRRSAGQQMATPSALPTRPGAPGALGVGSREEEDDLESLAKPTLTRRKDFIDKEEEARKSPNRVLYFRRNADYDRLIEVCDRKLADNPRNLRALLIRASSNLKKGAVECALSDYDAALALEPRNVDALFYRGSVLDKLGRLDEAIADFSRVLSLDPNHIKASYARGAARNLKGDFASAIGACGCRHRP